MSLKQILSTLAIALLISLNIMDIAEATTISVSCRYETEVGRIRSKVRVQASSLPRGKYYAKILSGGGGWLSSKPKAGRRVEFEFDSHSEPGKTLISENFVASGTVVAVIRKFKANGKVGPSMSAACEIR
jgi:hypothetical protein